MGVDTYFYIGPTIIIPYSKVPYDRTINTCSNEECSQHGVVFSTREEYKFCYKCGSEVKECKIEEHRQFTLHNLLVKYDLEDSIWPDVQYDSGEECPSINVMNFTNLHPNVEKGFEITEELKSKYMDRARNHLEVKKVFEMLAKENIEYEFKFISLVYYN